MATNQLNERLAEIRNRFASKLDAKFQETDTALPLLTGAGAESVAAIAATYRRFHEICGTGRTLGFNELGQAAGEVETILLEPFRAGRALTDAEVSALRGALDALKAKAEAELGTKRAARSTA